MFNSPHKYRIHIAPLSDEEGGGWIAYAPELPGCRSDGQSREEALRNVEFAIQEWIDEAKALGRAVPQSPACPRLTAYSHYLTGKSRHGGTFPYPGR